MKFRIGFGPVSVRVPVWVLGLAVPGLAAYAFAYWPQLWNHPLLKMIGL